MLAAVGKATRRVVRRITSGEARRAGALCQNRSDQKKHGKNAQKIKIVHDDTTTVTAEKMAAAQSLL
jgi:hypothetical protein